MKWFQWFDEKKQDVKGGLEWLDSIHADHKIVSDEHFLRMRVDQFKELSRTESVSNWHKWAVEKYLEMVVKRGTVTKRVYVQMVNLVNYHGFGVVLIDRIMEEFAERIESKYEFER
jgi:hypothetical protein